MSRRERLNRIVAVVFALGGGAIITVGIAKGLPATDSAGRLTSFALGFAILAIGISSLRGEGGPSGWDEFDGATSASRWVRRTALLVLVAAPVVILAVRGVSPWQHLREGRAETRVVQRRARSSERRAATLVAKKRARAPRHRVTLGGRCTAVLRRQYKGAGSGNALKNRFPPSAFALVAPEVCALGIEHALVGNDGTIDAGAERELVGAAIARMVPRVQRRVLNELAMTQYHLARRGHAARWHRCVASGYSGYDALQGGATLPPRGLFFGAVRHACAVGIARGFVPASGVPAPDSARSEALQRVLSATLVKLTH